jgi:hypothetical protein
MNEDRPPLPVETKNPIEVLAEAIPAWARKHPEKLKARLADLSDAEQRELALRLPAESRLELLLHAPKPMRLARSLPDGEFYLTVRGVDVSDALPLLALGSAPQLQHLLDLECWRGDRFDGVRAGAWISVISEAGEPALTRTLRNLDDEALTLLFIHWMRMDPILSDENVEVKGTDLTESGDERGAVSPDGSFRFNTPRSEHAQAAQKVLRTLFVEEPKRYADLLWHVRAALPSVLEEEALHWRQSRLEERGWPDLDEALAVYSPPLPTDDLRVAAPLRASTPEDEPGLIGSRLPLRTPDRPAWLQKADRHPDRETMLLELGSIANRILIADRRDPGDPEAHKHAMRRAVCGISLALESMHGDELYAALERRHLLEWFRNGWAQIEELTAEASRFIREDWPSTHPYALQLLDPPLDTRLAALLDQRPRYLDVAEDGSTSIREFKTAKDLEATRGSIRLAEVLGRVFFGRLGLIPAEWLGSGESAPPSDTPRFSTFLLTSLGQWTRHRRLSLEALDTETAREFLREIARFDIDPGIGEAAAGEWIHALGELKSVDPGSQAVLRRYAPACLARLRDETGRIDLRNPLKPHLIPCLLIEPETSGTRKL